MLSTVYGLLLTQNLTEVKYLIHSLNHLSYSSSSKSNILSFKGYVADTATKFDDVGNSANNTESLNEGF